MALSIDFITRVLHLTEPRTLYNSFFIKPLNEVISADLLLHSRVILVVAENLCQKLASNNKNHLWLRLGRAWSKVDPLYAEDIWPKLNSFQCQAELFIALAKSHRAYFNEAVSLSKNLLYPHNLYFQELALMKLADQNLEEAKSVARLMSPGVSRDKICLKILKAEVAQNLEESAKKTLTKIKDPLCLISAYCHLGRRDYTMISSAEKLAAKLRDHDEREKADQKIAKAKAYHPASNPPETDGLENTTLIAIVKIGASISPSLAAPWVPQIQDLFTRCLACIEMSHYLPDDFSQMAIDLAGQLTCPNEKTEAYIELAKMDIKLLALAKSAAVEKNVHDRVALLLKIADVDPSHDCSQALKKAKSIRNKGTRDVALRKIVDMQVKHNQVKMALDTARAINDPLLRSGTFAKIGKHKPEVLREAKMSTQKIDVIADRVLALCAIVDPAE